MWIQFEINSNFIKVTYSKKKNQKKTTHTTQKHCQWFLILDKNLIELS